MENTTSTATVTKTDVRLGSQIGTSVVLGLGVAFLASYLMAGFFFFQGGQKPLTTTNQFSLRQQAFAPRYFTAGTINKPFPSEMNQNLALLFIRDNVLLAQYYDFDGTWTFAIPDGSVAPWGSRTPLMIDIGTFDHNAATMPARTFKVVSDLGTTNLCVPRTVLATDSYQLYYYARDGRPYADPALTQLVPCVETASQ